MHIEIDGRLGADAERVTMKDGSSFIKFRAAEDEYDANTKQRKAEWYNVTCDESIGKNFFKYLTKGHLIKVLGHETIVLYTNKEGKTDYSRNVRAYHIEFGPSTGKASGDTTVETASEAATKPNAPAPNCGTLKAPVQPKPNTQKEPEDDLPF
jgi:single-stranded DNA-binding protein